MNAWSHTISEKLPVTIQSACEYDYPPYCLVSSNGVSSGFSVDLLQETLRIMNCNVTFRTGPWAKVKQMLIDGEVEVLPLVGYTPERKQYFDFTFPYLNMHGAIVIRNGQQDINAIDDLAGKRVAVMKGDNSEEFVKRIHLDAEIVTTDTFVEALRGLSDGNYDAVIIQRLVALQIIMQEGLHNLQVVGPPLTEFTQSFCFAVKKGNIKLLALLNEGLSIAIANGTFRKLYSKWFGLLEVSLLTNRRFVVGGDNNYPPFEFIDQNGEPAGYNVDITRAIARELGIPVDIQLSSWTNVMQQTKTGNIDILQGIFYSPQRDNQFDFSSAHLSISHVIATRKGTFQPQSLADITHKTILVQDGDIMHEYATQQDLSDHIITYPSQEDVLRQLINGKGDCALVTKYSALYLMEKYGWKTLRLSKKSIYTPEYCFAIPNGNTALLAWLDDGLTAIKNSGMQRAIYDKWFKQYNIASSPNYRRVAKYTFATITTLIVLLVAVFLWLRILRRQVRQRTIALQHEMQEREKTSESLKASEKQFRLLFEEMMDGLAIHEMIFDEDGTPRDYRFLQVNPAFEKLTGLNAKEIIGKTVLEVLPKTEHIWIKKYGNVVATGKSCRFRQYSQALNRYYYVTAFSPVPGQFATIVSDITDQTMARKKLEKSENNLKITLNSIGDAVIAVDTESRITLMNPVAEKLTGHSFSDACRQPLDSVFKIINSNRNPAYNPVLRAFETGTIVGLANDTLLISNDGTEYQISDSASPIRKRDGTVTGVVLVFRDITEEHRVREELQKMRRLESIGNLAGGIAHDFNNILMGLFGNISMAKLELSQDHPGYKLLQQAECSMERAVLLTNQLLTFAKGGEPIKSSVRLSKVIREVVAFDLTGSRVKPVFKFDDNLWHINADKSQLQQVFSNLTINAKDAMPDGGILEITLENMTIEANNLFKMKPGRYIRAQIKDTGTGIPHDNIDKVFDPYFTTKKTGNGLGLPTAYSIVTKHEGHISIQSVPGKGTSFILLLPAMDSAPPDSPSFNKSKIQSATLKHAQKILIMDDDDSVRKVTSAMLKSLGMMPVAVSSGEEAVEIYQKAWNEQKPFDAVITDLTVPGGMDGKQTTAKILSINPRAIVIVSSGYASDPIMAHYQEFGFKGCITKPFHKDRLKDVICQVLG